MATEILSIGSDVSAEFTVVAGTPAMLILRGAGNASIRVKASDNSFVNVGELDAMNRVRVLDVAGTYVVARLNGSTVEVDKEG